MSGPTAQSRAIDKSKGFYGRVQGEPLVPTDRVLLREVVHSLEILWGYTDHELNFNHDPRAPQKLNDALCDGSLVARVYRESLEPNICPIIPSVSWRRIDPAKGENAADAGFWCHSIHYDEDCEGFGGELPFIIREEAELWLSEQSALSTVHDTRSRIFQLFEEARGSLPLSPSDPLIPRACVTVSDVAYALERLRGLGIERLAYGHTPEIYELLLSALIDQRLIARMIESDVVVPSQEWERFRNKGVSAFKSGFISGGLEFVLHEDPKIRGMTPVLPAAAVADWLVEICSEQPSRAEQIKKFSTENELLVWYRDSYLPTFDAGSLPKSAERASAIMALDAVGMGDRRDRARRIMKKCDDPAWRRGGRNRKYRK